MWFSMAVNFILSAIKEATKNPVRRAQLRTKLLEIRDAIDALYSPQDGA
jgi:hypothetical protein